MSCFKRMTYIKTVYGYIKTSLFYLRQLIIIIMRPRQSFVGESIIYYCNICEIGQFSYCNSWLVIDIPGRY